MARNLRNKVDLKEADDAYLIVACRRSDSHAAGVLYERHHRSAVALARVMGPRQEAEDNVAEAFARILGAFTRGNGPTVAFRPYLLTTVRNVIFERARKKTPAIDSSAGAADALEQFGHDGGLPYSSPDENLALADAFRQLPERWQTVLWHLDVEGESPKDVAMLLGTSPEAISSLGYRARNGLRETLKRSHVGVLGAVNDEDATDDGGADVTFALRNAIAPAILGVPLVSYLNEISLLGSAVAVPNGGSDGRRNRVTAGIVVAATLVLATAVGAAAALRSGGNDPKPAPQSAPSANGTPSSASVLANQANAPESATSDTATSLTTQPSDTVTSTDSSQATSVVTRPEDPASSSLVPAPGTPGTPGTPSSTTLGTTSTTSRTTGATTTAATTTTTTTTFTPRTTNGASTTTTTAAATTTSAATTTAPTTTTTTAPTTTTTSEPTTTTTDEPTTTTTANTTTTVDCSGRPSTRPPGCGGD